MTPCEHCGKETPDEAFCTWCGAHRAGPLADARTRRKDYAAHSGEHVAQPAVVTTLLPHLPRHRVHEFRWALIGGIAVVVALVGAGLIVAAILAAAVLVPALYLVYLYEAQVYRDEPAMVLGLTIVAGVVVGVIVSVIFQVIEPLRLTAVNGLNAPDVPVSYVLITTLLVPVIQEIVKVLPVYGLWTMGGQSKFSETIDGLTFGVAAGLGFAAAETVVLFSDQIAHEAVRTSSAGWLAPILTATVLKPLLQGTCTGMIAAVLWKPGRLSRPLYFLGIPLAIVAHIAFSLVSQVLADSNVNSFIVLFYQAAIVGVLLVYIRHIVHDALLDEAKDFGFQVVTCPHCRHQVGAAGFCPRCGGAIAAGPRSAVTAAVTAPENPSPPASPVEGAATGGANA
ncbi:MAG TPA: PrsW family intramembrane metalloprotease [Acidimicrobiales bacterium]|nr:PrsW family intramembrane metalloprotease [Acidimicrobiales bacterium]